MKFQLFASPWPHTNSIRFELSGCNYILALLSQAFCCARACLVWLSKSVDMEYPHMNSTCKSKQTHETCKCFFPKVGHLCCIDVFYLIMSYIPCGRLTNLQYPCGYQACMPQRTKGSLIKVGCKLHFVWDPSHCVPITKEVVGIEHCIDNKLTKQLVVKVLFRASKEFYFSFLFSF